MIRAPEILESLGGDELETGRGDGGIAEDVEVLSRDVAADIERVTCSPAAAQPQTLSGLSRWSTMLV